MNKIDQMIFVIIIAMLVLAGIALMIFTILIGLEIV